MGRAIMDYLSARPIILSLERDLREWTHNSRPPWHGDRCSRLLPIVNNLQSPA